ncbi:MAG: hypothetical protein HKN47_16250 [Pirellulaceae bacterium]|nr:hypothetical protein [Pirellulaceae bacterium]
MSTVTHESNVPANCVAISEEEIRSRVSQVRSRWSAAERARRESLGRARREMLLSVLGLVDHAECA